MSPSSPVARASYGRIEHQVRSGTTVIVAEDAALFGAAGVPTVTTPDMHA
ncbi:hypothetical protein [Cystobacter ferrugineus]|nr:hypothetical protein [Cystobacter ferrugineus]